MGYADYRQEVQVKLGQELKVNIYIEPTSIESEAIVVTADSVRTAVRLFHKEISNIELSPLEIRRLPAMAESDLLRTLQSLPGVLPLSDFSSAIYVRGGTSDQNLYLIDGADVYNPEHAFGIFSTFNTDAIKEVNLSKGGFTADYGGRLSSVMDVTNLDGNRKEFEGTADISSLSAKATLQMPIGSIGAVSASFRRTYIVEVLSLFYPEMPDYYFYDGHLKGFFDLDPNNKITLSFYNGRDNLNLSVNPDEPEAPTFGYFWGNTTGSLRWTHIFNPRFFSNFWVTASEFDSEFDFEIEQDNLKETNGLVDISFKGQFEYVFTNTLSTKFGFEQKNLATTWVWDLPGAIVDVSRQEQLFSVYAALLWQPTIRWSIEPGVRYNQFHGNKKFSDWAPRLAAKYRFTDTINLKASTGVFYQYLNKLNRPFIADIWITADEFHDRSKAVHYVLGIQKEVAASYEFEVEGYYKEYDNIYTLKNYFPVSEPTRYDAQGRPVFTSTEELFYRGDGRSLGLEFLLRKKTGPITGWLAYSIANTKYDVDDLNQENPFNPRHDRAHVINAVVNTDITNSMRVIPLKFFKHEKVKWKFSANFVFTSGQPITLPSSTYSAFSIPDQQQNQLHLYPSARNEFRLPAYARLDLSISRERQYSGWSMAFYFQVFNVGNRENVWFISYDSEVMDDRIEQTVETTNMFPLIMAGGVKFNF
jgi:outer membrane cobalamin receptor